MRVGLWSAPGIGWLVVGVVCGAGCGDRSSTQPAPDVGEPDAPSEDGAESDAEAPQDGGADTDATGEPRPVVCGDGVLSPSEECEAFDVRGQRCVDLGFDSGRLTCGADCTLDTSLCVRCGDGIRQGDELCDGGVDAEWTCERLVGAGSTGTVTCDATCDGVDTSGCSDPPVDGAFAPCDLEGPPCAGGRVCTSTAAGPLCITPCTTNADCDGADYCAALGDGASTCIPRAAEGEACAADRPCGDGRSCVAAFAGDEAESVCVRRCDAGCSAEERCVEAPSGITESAATVPCDLSNPSSCPVGATCVDEGAGALPRCVRPVSFCAVPRAPYGYTSGGPDDAQLCDFTGPTDGGRFCAGSGGPGDADFVCYPVFGDDSALGACVGLCDDGSVGGLGDLACGRGWTCGVPALQGLFVPQPDLAECTEADRSACAAGYSFCVDLGEGLTCARSARICIPSEGR